MKQITFLTLFLFVFAACKKPKDVEFVQIKKVTFAGIGQGQVRMSILSEMNNPNDFGMELLSSDLDIYWDDQLIGNTRQQQKINIPANDHFDLPLEINFKVKDLLKKLGKDFTQITLDEKVKIRMKGSCTVRKSSISIDVPVDITQEVEIPFKQLLKGVLPLEF